MYCLALFGSSGSGKTTIANAIAKEHNALVLGLDNFYFDIPYDMHNRDNFIDNYNFDEPSAIDWKLLRECLCSLMFGIPTTIPNYDFKTHRRFREGQSMVPARYSFIIVEGIHAWKLDDLCDLLVYIDANLDECYRRRLNRDVLSYGKELNVVINKWDSHVKPCFFKYIKNNKHKAQFIIKNDDSHIDTHFIILSSFINSKIKK